jgi:hypothetical protein
MAETLLKSVVAPTNTLQLVQKSSLTPKQLLAAQRVSQCCTNQQIIAEVRISLSTLLKWKRSPEFQQQVRVHVDEIVKVSQQRLRSLMSVALDALQRAAQSPVNSVATRAAEIILRSQPTTVPESTGKLMIKFGGLRRVVDQKPK